MTEQTKEILRKLCDQAESLKKSDSPTGEPMPSNYEQDEVEGLTSATLAKIIGEGFNETNLAPSKWLKRRSEGKGAPKGSEDKWKIFEQYERDEVSGKWFRRK